MPNYPSTQSINFLFLLPRIKVVKVSIPFISKVLPKIYGDSVEEYSMKEDSKIFKIKIGIISMVSIFDLGKMDKEF